MKSRFSSILSATFALIIGGFMTSANADWDINFGGISASDPQDLIVSFASDPNHDPEAACLAVTFARSLAANPNANLTLFVTLDGVNLANKKYISKRRMKRHMKRYECTTPWGKLSLVDHLTAYLDGNQNRMIVCPICWAERYEDLPDYGVLPGADGVPDNAIGLMMFNADKVLSF